MVIRPVTKQDIESVRRLFEELTGHAVVAETVENRLIYIKASPTEQLHVCELDGGIAGVLGFRIREDIEDKSRYGEVSLIVTASAARKRGVGRKLMEYAEKLAHENNCKGLWLVSGFCREEEAHAFYKKLGFEITGYRFVKRFR
jgi:GNAT superfamily N-acetyltransferase